ncbi:MAG: putative rane protein [Chloroflexi bacterium]|nr:putative rane protein [Chloroflexota bacterium]
MSRIPHKFYPRETGSGGLIRLVLVLFVITAMAIWSIRAFSVPDRLVLLFFSLRGLRYWIFPIAGLLIAILLAGHYLRDLYELPSLRLGIRYMISVVFSLGLPALKIDKDRIDTDSEKVNLLERIGGPGNLNILPGYLALLENPEGPSNVYAAGGHYVSRREWLQAVANLEDQHGYIESRTATTKDGIEVTVQEIRFHYRLWPSRRHGEYVPRSPEAPFPYSNQSMRNYIYNRVVSEKGLVSLVDSLDNVVSSVITSYVNEHHFDYLTSPQFGVDPRGEIRKKFQEEGTRERFRNLGTELLWVDIGHFDVADEIWQKRVETWSAKWVGEAKLQREEGAAKRLSAHRTALAEGRANALEDLIQTLDNARLQQTPKDRLRSLVLLYTAQILEEMSETTKDQGSISGSLPPQNKT